MGEHAVTSCNVPSPCSCQASFVDNQISHIEGLESCVLLEELCLEDNRLTSIENLTGLIK